MLKAIKLSFTVILLLLSASGLLNAQDVIRASGGTDLSIDLISSGQYVTYVSSNSRCSDFDIY